MAVASVAPANLRAVQLLMNVLTLATGITPPMVERVTLAQ